MVNTHRRRRREIVMVAKVTLVRHMVNISHSLVGHVVNRSVGTSRWRVFMMSRWVTITISSNSMVS